MVDVQIVRYPRRYSGTPYRNQVTNPKLALVDTGWSGDAAGGAVSSNGRFVSGSPYVPGAAVWRIQWSAVPGGALAQIAAPAVPVTPGSVISGGIAIRTSAATGAVTRAIIEFYNAGGTFISNVQSPLVNQTSVWQWHELVGITVPTGAATARVKAATSNPGSWVVPTASIDATCAAITNFAGAAGSFWDGDTQNTYIYEYAWDGAANASTSRRTLLDPADITTPLLMLAESMTLRNATNNTVHQILGASLPIVTAQPLGGRAGSFRFLFATLTSADAFLVNLREAANSVLLYPDEPSMIFRFALADGDIETTLDPETQTAWIVTVPVVEVAP